jgi:hypothetical protein
MPDSFKFHENHNEWEWLGNGDLVAQPSFGDIPKTLLFGTAAKQPVFHRQKPRSKLETLLNVFGPTRASNL